MNRTRSVSLLFGASLTFVASLALSSVAGAATVGYLISEDGGSAVGGTSATPDFLSTSGAFGDFSVNTIQGISADGAAVGSPLLSTGSINVEQTGAGAHTLTIAISASGFTNPASGAAFLSAFTENNLAAGWTATLTSFLGTNLFDTTTLLGSASFSGGTGSSTTASSPESFAGNYSLTAIYTIITSVTSGIGAQSSATVTIGQVPLPGALPMFAGGLLGLVGLMRRRKQVAQSAI